MSNQSHPDPQNAGAREQKRDVRGDIHVRGEVEVKVPVEVTEKREATEKTKESRDKIRLVVEFVGLGFVVIYAGLTGLLAYYTSGQASAAKKSADTAQQEFQLTQRPWLALGNVEAAQLVVKDGVAFTLVSYQAKNVGHSVAIHVTFSPKIVSHSAEALRGICDVGTDWQKETERRAGGLVVFPDQTIGGQKIPAPRWKEDKTTGDEQKSPLRLIACLYYVSPVDKLPHHTALKYWIVGKDSRPMNLSEEGQWDISLQMDINGSEAD